MKKIFITMLFSLLLMLGGFTQTVTTTIADQTGTPGQIASVSITVSGMDDTEGETPIIGLQMLINYQTSVVTYMDFTNFSPTLSGLGTFFFSNINEGVASISWLANIIDEPVGLPDGTELFTINFLCNGGGISPLILDPASTKYFDVTNTALLNILDDGSITFGTPFGSTTWNGTGNWYTSANWSNGIPGGGTDAIIASGVVTVNAADGYTGDLTVEPGAGVTLNNGSASNPRNIYVNGDFILNTNNTNAPTGSLLFGSATGVQYCDVITTGARISKRFLTGATQHFISIPVTQADVNDLIDPLNTGYLFLWNEPGTVWKNPWGLDYELLQAKGYAINYDSDETVTLSGVFNNDATYSPSVTRLAGGWNLVGNPYPIAMDWDNAGGWTKTNLDNAIYIWNTNVYASYVGGVSTNGGSRYIPQFQGFWIHSSTSTPAFAAKKAGRIHNSVNFMKEEVANVFKMSLTNGSLSDETAVYMNSEATVNFDTEYDAYKLFGFNEDAPHIYTSAAGTDYSINGQPFAESLSLPVAVKTSQSGEFTFTASGFDTFDGYYFFILEDKETGINYDLKTNSVLALNLNNGETNDRFTLRIFKSALGIGDEELNATRIYSENKSVYIENCPEGQVDVYNISGKIIASRYFGESSLNIMPLEVTAGIYVVRMTAENGSISSKVFIK